MPSNTVSRRLVAYAIHGRSDAGVLDYGDFFATLAQLSFDQRRMTTGEQFAAIAEVTPRDDAYVLRFVTGTPGVAPVLFDTATGRERLGDLSRSEIVAASVIAVVNPFTRGFVLERRRPGVPVATIERLLTRIGRDSKYGSTLTISLTPVPSESFLEELDDFERVRRAEVVLARPNFDWSDQAAVIAAYGDESNAASIELAATAGRGDSLDKSNGLLADIRALASRPINALKNVRVIGRKQGEATETSASLEQHVMRRDVLLPRGASNQTQEEQVAAEAADFLDELQLEADDEPA